MDFYNWTQTLHGLYDHAVALYKSGQRGADTFFDDAQTEFLASLGLKPIQIYDFAEDWVGHGEPDWDTALLMIAVRRNFFIHEMNHQWCVDPIREVDLPPKAESYEGIDWLPRIIPKAQGFLEGALPPEIMYGCGGDRKFFKANNLHPADFLRAVWAAKSDKDQLVAYIRSQNP